MKKNRYIAMLLLIYLYFVFLSYCILFKGSFAYFQECMARIASGDVLVSQSNWVPFRSLKTIVYNWKNPWLIMNLLVNVWLFCPWGMFCRYLCKPVWTKHFLIGTCLTLVVGVGVSFGYEWVQLRTGIGTFDVDDMILNGLGTLLGCAAIGLIEKRRAGEMGPDGAFVPYALVQAMAHLSSLTVWTTLVYICSVPHPWCDGIGLLCGAGMGSVLQWWFLEPAEMQERFGSIREKTDLFVAARTAGMTGLSNSTREKAGMFASLLLQIGLLHVLVQKLLPNGLFGLAIATVLWSIVCLIGYLIWRIKRF